ncbi:MAG: DHH family phosphoesterase [Candidatus Merdivicinus sp.]|jgi:c-di-AMP phosphodiesterase-like protein
MKNKRVGNLLACLILLSAISLILAGMMFFISPLAFYIAFPIAAAACGLTVWHLVHMQSLVHAMLQKAMAQLSASQRRFLQEFPLPIMIVTGDREIIWYSDKFREEVVNQQDLYGFNLNQIIKEDLAEFCTPQGKEVICCGNWYRVYGVFKKENTTELCTLYFVEMTSLKKEAELYEKTRPSVMMIMLDNYGEVMQHAKESEKSRILGAIDSTLEDFISSTTTSFIKRFDGDKFLMVVEEQHLEKIIDSRFKILDEIRKIQTDGNIPVTLSIGVGRGEPTLAKSEAAARQALDMALGRGGDQAAIKNQSMYEFYGGVSKGVEKRTKVKTRIVANALSELIQNADRVLVMGHKFGDLDCVGAAVGLAYAIRTIGKQADVVIDRDKTLANILVEMVTGEGCGNLFVDPSDALFSITEDTLLIICDTHTVNLVESADIYNRCKTVVVIDHHRKMVNHIDNAVIFYHEPYASSASEMVTELIQYMGDNCRINAVIAQALLSGIMLDTRNFVLRTGVRTFEAAAYLRRIGADTITVRKLFSSTMDSYQRRSRIVAAAQIYKKCAVAESNFVSDDMRIVAPQAADELLGIDGVDGSFVLYESEGVVSISARSMGAINVQMIMETLGGGGHHTMAGAQIKGVEMEKVKQMLLEAIDKYYKTHG